MQDVIIITLQMAILKFSGVGISAMSACVPSVIAQNKDLTYLIPPEEIEKTIRSIGINERRISDKDVCSSDLCYKAALKLMSDNNIAPDSIDVLLYMSQTSDYRIPATAPILQQRLGLSQNTACLDLSLGCSGYVYALSTAYAYASMPSVRRVLLLDGETFSKIVDKYDKVNAPLYGDAGTATLIEKGEYGDSVFILRTDGSGEDAVKIPAGMRIPVTEESCMVTEREDGNRRSDLEVYMNGMDVFNFAIRVVPKSIKEIVEYSGTTLGDVDYVIYHQSNRFMTDFFTKRLKIDQSKVPYSIDRFGNTSSASIPLTIVSELSGSLKGKKRTVLCGFGAGLSWGTAAITFNDCRISPLIEYK